MQRRERAERGEGELEGQRICHDRRGEGGSGESGEQAERTDSKQGDTATASVSSVEILNLEPDSQEIRWR